MSEINFIDPIQMEEDEPNQTLAEMNVNKYSRENNVSSSNSEEDLVDIEIEEHDVLDHPRIRNMFPDLSIIKTEVLSDPEDYPETSYQDYTNMSIKEEYNENFEDCTEYDGTLEESYIEVELPAEDMHHFNNKIILGSKPDPYTDQANDLTDNVDAFVLLDDWGRHLEESPSYCKHCQILFATPNALDAHKMTAHSFLVAVSVNKAKKSTTKGSLNYARKSTTCVTRNEEKRLNFARKSTGTVTSKPLDMTKFCNHCNFTFPDHTSLITHLYELLPTKEFTCTECSEIFKNQNELIEHTRTHVKSELESNPPTCNVMKYICLICKKEFANYTRARKHKIREHSEMVKFARVIDKINSEPNDSKNNSNVSDLKVKTEKDPSEYKLAFEDTPIPKSVLFKCGKCNLNFLQCYAGIRHFRICKNNSNERVSATWQCKTCTRMFRPSARHIHTNQHKISGKFRVYKIHSSQYERVLCECSKCKVCYDEFLIKHHFAKCCGQPSFKRCNQCDLRIDKDRFQKHERKHRVLKWKPKDFIVIEYSWSREMSNSVKKEPGMATDTKIKGSIAEKINFESDAEEKNVKSNHAKINKKIKLEANADTINMYICKHCNCCTSKSGYVPENHKTKSCRKCYFRICDHCGLFFSNSSWQIHRELHKTRKFTIHDIDFFELGTKKPVRPPVPPYPNCNKCKIHFASRKLLRDHTCGEDYKTCPTCNKMYEKSSYKLHKPFHDYGMTGEEEIMPELLKKYQSLQKMWHILYFCDDCDINMDSYDKAVEHSQKHFSRKEREGQKVITCFKCQLNFDDTCWAKHRDLHSRNVTINKKDFCVLPFKPMNLLTDQWMNILETLPQDQVSQIISRSLYSVTRSVKMNLVKDGRPDLTIYCCSRCKISVRTDAIDIHVHEKGCCKSSKEICLICGVNFCNLEVLREHQKMHIDGIGKDDFRVVHFNVTSDRTLNKALNIAKTKSDESPIDNHTKEIPISKADNNKLKVKNVQKRKFKLKPRNVLYRCNNCNVCLSSKKSRANHPCVADSSQRTCEICKHQFAYQMIGKHLAMHKDNPSISDNFKIVTFNPKHTKMKQKGKEPIPVNKVKESKIYKCDCGLHFTSLVMIEKHLAVCTPDQRGPEVSCSKCGLLFPTEVLVTHLCKHHSKYTKIVIEEIHKPAADTSVDSTDVSQSFSSDETDKPSGINKASVIKLYKCGQCNVYFLTQATCYKHTVKHVRLDPKQYIECKLCGLQFTILSLTKHLKRHHDREFNLEKVLIEEYHPNTEPKKAPKIDIYFAVDRVQSLLVSSSNEN